MGDIVIGLPLLDEQIEIRENGGCFYLLLTKILDLISVNNTGEKFNKHKHALRVKVG